MVGDRWNRAEPWAATTSGADLNSQLKATGYPRTLAMPVYLPSMRRIDVGADFLRMDLGVVLLIGHERGWSAVSGMDRRQ